MTVWTWWFHSIYVIQRFVYAQNLTYQERVELTVQVKAPSIGYVKSWPCILIILHKHKYSLAGILICLSGIFQVKYRIIPLLISLIPPIKLWGMEFNCSEYIKPYDLYQKDKLWFFCLGVNFFNSWILHGLCILLLKSERYHRIRWP